MPFTMPVNRAIKHYDKTRNAEQRTMPSMNLYSVYDGDIGKMYPERNNLPQGVKDAIRYSERNTY